MSSTPADAAPRSFEPLELPDRNRRKWSTRLVIALVLVSSALAYYAWNRRRTGSIEAFRTAEVTRQTVIRNVSATGHLDAHERVEVPAPMGGRLLDVLVVAGDVVTEGQLLARLDPRPQVLQVGSAQATVTAASSRLGSAGAVAAAARSALERTQQLVARGLASEADVGVARVQLEQADAMVRAARADRALAANGLENARLGEGAMELRAPVAGVILRAPRDVGGLVGPERGALFVVGVGLDEVTIEASIGEADVALLRAGQAATFEVPAFVGRTFQATVTRVEIDGSVADGAVTYAAFFSAPNPDRVLYPGMTTILRVEVSRAVGVLAVPEAALRFVPPGAEDTTPRTRIWRRVGPARLEPIDVVAGLSDGMNTEVTAAVSGQLREGTRVAIGMGITEEEAGGAGITLGSGGPRAAAR
jgi:HlyD family secretion protein